MTSSTWRAEQVGATREALLAAAERLFGEYGVHAVALRQIVEAAGQGNNAAIAYHFGTKTDLIRAIARRHIEHVERMRARMLADIADSMDVRDWVSCLVRPTTEHLEALGSPSWYARFVAQICADPALHAIMIEESLAVDPMLQRFHGGVARCLPALSTRVHAERAVMARHLVVQTAVDRERALAANAPTFHATWEETASSLVDVIVALWQAPGPRSE
jgi:AcrR family transcriptional regulator